MKINEEVKNSKVMKSANGLWGEFKKFITRGNVIDLSVGVIMGSAFGAIVTAFTNILLSVCTWGVPGGINGLITALPAISSSQISPLGEKYQKLTIKQYVQGVTVGDTTYNTAALSNYYVSYGGDYYYKGLAIINWGAIINAIISFIIISLVLFIILKVYNTLKNKRAAKEQAKLEKMYEEHPELRPVEAPKPVTEVDLLTSINENLTKLLSEKEATK